MGKNVTRFATEGMTNGKSTWAYGNFILPDRVGFAHEFTDDFDLFVAAEWTVTKSSTLASTLGVADADGGILEVIPPAADDGNIFIQTLDEIYTFTSGKEEWFKARWKVSDATQSDLVFGLQVRDTSPLAVSDGVYFRKDDGDANLDFVVVAGSTATTQTAVSTISSSVYVTTAFYYNGVDSVAIFVNDQQVGSSVTTNLPTTELTVSFGLQNGSSNAKTLSVDYIHAAKER